MVLGAGASPAAWGQDATPTVLAPTPALSANAPTITPPPIAPTPIAPTPIAPTPSGPTLEVARLCTDPAGRLEREYGLAPGILTAIGLAESGRRLDTGGLRPWPWTIHAQGRGRYFATQAEAVEAVRLLMLDGETNIDVGCMQISLYWHNLRFATLEDMFDPQANLAYAAEYLAELHARHGTWERTVGYYHSADSERRETYLRRVLAHWQRGGQGNAAVVSNQRDTPAWRAADAMAEGRTTAALVLYAEALEANPDDRTAHLGTALALDAEGRAEEARAAWERLLVLDPANPRALHRLTSAARALPPDQGEARAHELLRLAPGAEPFAGLLAERLAARGAVDDAVAVLRASALHNPAAPLPWLNAAIMLDRAGRPQAALTHYRAFLSRYTAMPVPLTVPIDQVVARLRHLERG